MELSGLIRLGHYEAPQVSRLPYRVLMVRDQSPPAEVRAWEDPPGLFSPPLVDKSRSQKPVENLERAHEFTSLFKCRPKCIDSPDSLFSFLLSAKSALLSLSDFNKTKDAMLLANTRPTRNHTKSCDGGGGGRGAPCGLKTVSRFSLNDMASMEPLLAVSIFMPVSLSLAAQVNMRNNTSEIFVFVK
ncbi:hypothetical protein RRG08_018997 [Elysia crispata]|uniref:Uncharacterized protein n=1 Tax=Elysia crispata TaxID=231223 RepID=A0AAE1A658_9GAST|nr:hypothetical protein RRG08_018997 [Elysia crispata]